MYLRFLLSVILASLTCFPVLAQQEQIQFSTLDISRGLSHNQVNAILKDEKGWMWFGTLAGLNRFDGYSVKVFKHDPRDSTSITDDFITRIFELPFGMLYLETRGGPSIYDPVTETFSRDVKPFFKRIGISVSNISDAVKDSKGNFWFNAGVEGLYKYTTATKQVFSLQGKNKVGAGFLKTPVVALFNDDTGWVWTIHEDKTIQKLDPGTGKVVEQILQFKQPLTGFSKDYRMFADKKGGLWIYTLNKQDGIQYYNTKTGEKKFINKGPGGLNNNLINHILEDNNGLIWIATDHGGINLIDQKSFKIRYLVNKENDPKSIGQNSVLSMYRDDTGIIWLGTFKKGISFYHEKILKFPLYRHQDAPDGLTYEDVNRFAEDQSGNLWIGTNGGGLFNFNRKTGKFKRYKHESGNANSLSNDIIVSLYIDRQQVLWIGTYFGGLDSFDGKKFRNYKHQQGVPGSLTDDRVWDILEDGDDNLWVATLSGGLDKLDRSTDKFSHIKAGVKNSIRSDFISCLLEDKKGNLWIGTSEGIDVRSKSGKFRHYDSKDKKNYALINNIVYDLMEDSRGFIWVATRDGISRINPVNGHIRNFDSKNGLTEQATLKIIEDNSGNLWISTAKGLFNVLIKPDGQGDFNYSFRRFDEHDGLQGSAFNANAGFKTRAGEILFGGANGFNLFKPEQILSDQTTPQIVLTGLQLANRDIEIGEPDGGNIILKSAINNIQKLELHYDQNNFALSFAALNYFSPSKIRYQYMLEGFDDLWQDQQAGSRIATYTNIDPGEYVFKVRSTNAGGEWVKNEIRLPVRILPPFWRTPAAYFIYCCAFAGTLLFIRHRGIQKIKRAYLLEQERQQAKRIHDLDLLKIKFLTNVSHEFRTPLSLIITPMDKLIRQADEREKPQLQMILRNGKRLLNLVNQLLDFRKMEVSELKLQTRKADLIGFIRELVYSFSDVAEGKHISLSFQTNGNELITSFDQDKMERIVFNLLSNAFKFTPQDGVVQVDLEVKPLQGNEFTVVLKITDTGIGISAEKQNRIFERFFQDDVPHSMVNQGSGIGLAITREFVRLHGGTIEVESTIDQGSIFTVIFKFTQELDGSPITQRFSSASERIEISRETPVIIADINRKNKKPVVILIEDNEDFRFYLKDNLQEYFQIAEAGNGLEGWQKIISIHPDLVVSDVSMPEMNGIDLCRKIRADKRTTHLPVILLTALSTEDQQLTGLDTGANDYMTKPFNFEILLSKIKNLLSQQEISRKTYLKQVELKPADAEIESVDDKFIRQIGMHLEKNLQDSNYTVDQLSADMNMSRVGLYKKILPLTGRSPLEYIRFYRLLKSKPLLRKSQLTIAEIAYAVGFSNPKQFSKYFKQEFGTLPSVYAGQDSE
ncbi:Signal transduction histidine kinase [Pedobacter antarcticus]|nr:Signal transduction histidine kinase [Pedobacter antarcticus]